MGDAFDLLEEELLAESKQSEFEIQIKAFSEAISLFEKSLQTHDVLTIDPAKAEATKLALQVRGDYQAGRWNEGQNAQIQVEYERLKKVIHLYKSLQNSEQQNENQQESTKEPLQANPGPTKSGAATCRIGIDQRKKQEICQTFTPRAKTRADLLSLEDSDGAEMESQIPLREKKKKKSDKGTRKGGTTGRRKKKVRPALQGLLASEPKKSGLSAPSLVVSAPETLSTPTGPQIYRAKYWHKPPIKEWLAFNEGDLITQLPKEKPEHKMDGWERGMSGSTGLVGMFPLAYVEFHSIDNSEIEPPPALVTMTPEELEEKKRMNMRNRKSHMRLQELSAQEEGSVPLEEVQEMKRRRRGIEADKRASVLISRQLSEEPKEKEKEEELSIDSDSWSSSPDDGIVSITNKYPANSKEKKIMKKQMEELVKRILDNDPNVKRADFSDCKIPHSQTKKLIPALAKNTYLYYLNLSNTGITSLCLQLMESGLSQNITLREIDFTENGFGMAEAKILESSIQKNFGVVKLHLFTPEELKKRETTETMNNINWYLNSNKNFIAFYEKRSTELRLCGRRITNSVGWEKYPETTLLNASHNYLKSINPKISELKNLTELNLSHNDISFLPYTFGQLSNLKVLDVSSNVLKEVPSSLDRCRSLTTLDLSKNKIKFFPRSVIQLPSLQKLVADENRAKIPKGLTHEELVSLILRKHSKA